MYPLTWERTKKIEVSQTDLGIELNAKSALEKSCFFAFFLIAPSDHSCI